MDARLAREAGEFFKGQPAGGVVRVTRGAQVLPRAAYGLSDVENGVPMRIDAARRVASIGKHFTATSPLAETRAGQTNAMRRALLLCIEDTHIEDTAHPSAIAFRPTVP